MGTVEAALVRSAEREEEFAEAWRWWWKQYQEWKSEQPPGSLTGYSTWEAELNWCSTRIGFEQAYRKRLVDDFGSKGGEHGE